MVFKYDAEADEVTDWRALDGLRTNSEAEAFINHVDLVFKWGAPGE